MIDAGTAEVSSKEAKKESLSESFRQPSSLMVPGEKENVLNNYRNVTYNITLAALTPENLKKPKSYRDKKLKYVIASSKGKGSGAISADVTSKKTNIFEDRNIEEDGRFIGSEKVLAGVKEDYGAREIVEEFNKVSPGRFDIFIDGLEVETLLSPNKQTGPAIATKIKFEIYEPMSANGFIEALHVSALAAGWTGYLNACYVIRLDFLGYPDDISGPVSETKLINATRFFPLKLTGTEMEITETGTKYRVSAVPYNETGFATPNQIFSDISFSGDNVKQVLESLFEGINKSTKERAAKEKSAEGAKIFDTYEIYFPALPKPGESLKIETVDTPISKAKINEKLRSNVVYKFPPIEEVVETKQSGSDDGSYDRAEAARLSRQGSANNTTPQPTKKEDSQQRYYPEKNQIQFAANSNIHEIIEAVIRDSLYFEQQVLKDIETAIKGDGMIDYFQIMINTVPGPMDTTFNLQTFTYQYIVCPYKVHYSKLPGQQNTNFNADSMKNYIKRIYNYLYTGKNIDVLNFRLNFNNLFFQAANPKMSNNDASDTAQAAGASNDQVVRHQTNGAKEAPKDQNDRPPTMPSASAGSTNGRGQPIQQNPYYQIAYTAHKAILESVNMLTGEIEILGDPFYLATGGMGNFLPELKDYAITETGEANFNNGPVVVRINFKNPIDIDETTGLAIFSKTAVPFSGAYQVLKCNSTFRDGAFKQKLNLMRYNGQLNDNSKLDPTAKDTQYTQEAKPGEQQVVDKAPADVARSGVQPNEVALVKWLDKGLPSVGLPGQFANLLEGGNINLKTVTGALGPGLNLLNQTSNIASGLRIGDALTGINPLTKGIPVNAGALTSLLGSPLSGAAALTQIGNQLTSLVPGNVNNLIKTMDAQNVSSVLTDVGNATSKIVGNVAASAGALAKNAVASVSNSIDAVKSIDSAGLMNNVQGKISNITAAGSSRLTSLQQSAVIQDAIDKGIPPDQALRNAAIFGVNLKNFEEGPSALASKLGIDASQLSGLTGKLDSKVIDQLQEVAKELPTNVNLDMVKRQGIIFANIDKDALKNIPAIPPITRAPIPDLPFSVKSDSLPSEERARVIEDALEKGIPVDQALRNAAIFGKMSIPGTIKSPLESVGAFGKTVADSAASKIMSIQNNISKTVGFGSNLPAGLTGAAGIAGSFESQLSSAQKMLGNPDSGVTQLKNLGKSVTSKFGSISASVASPLEKYMNNSVNSLNDPNAPPYTGTDPIIRRRLGLPPIEEL